VLKVHVAKVYFKCFRCFRGMLQVFHINVAKVDLDVAHVAIAIHVCCKSLFNMFHLFQTYVATVLSGCCKSRFRCCIYKHVASVYFKCFMCFIRMLQVFCLNVAYVCNGYICVFKFFLVFCKCFRRILQVFLLFRTYVASVLYGCCKNR
jgi:hypothetical protein